jgi:restriction system protein
MTVWLVRAGSHGVYEQKFIQERRIYATWENLNVDLRKLEKPALSAELTKRYPDDKPRAISNWVSQVWPFAHDMKPGDMILLPLKSQPAIQVGEIAGEYHYDAAAPDPYYHWRAVKWIGEAVPRTYFAQDLLYSFGVFKTISRIQRNDAEARLLAMKANGWKPEALAATVKIVTSTQGAGGDNGSGDTDLEELARDQIIRLIMARFKGHHLTRLVDAILKAQGYTTYRSPEGPDGGADILAGSGPLGFAHPRLCVEVKSESGPIDRPTVDKLLGAVSKFSADEGLFVSWSGFKPNVQKELAGSFFKMRLWSQNELLEQLFRHYEQLDEDIRAELPLKRVWMVAAQEEG